MRWALSHNSGQPWPGCDHAGFHGCKPSAFTTDLCRCPIIWRDLWYCVSTNYWKFYICICTLMTSCWPRFTSTGVQLTTLHQFSQLWGYIRSNVSMGLELNETFHRAILPIRLYLAGFKVWASMSGRGYWNTQHIPFDRRFVWSKVFCWRSLPADRLWMYHHCWLGCWLRYVYRYRSSRIYRSLSRSLVLIICWLWHSGVELLRGSSHYQSLNHQSSSPAPSINQA